MFQLKRLWLSVNAIIDLKRVIDRPDIDQASKFTQRTSTCNAYRGLLDLGAVCVKRFLAVVSACHERLGRFLPGTETSQISTRSREETWLVNWYTFLLGCLFTSDCLNEWAMLANCAKGVCGGVEEIDVSHWGTQVSSTKGKEGTALVEGF